jgi:hypothetical protein
MMQAARRARTLADADEGCDNPVFAAVRRVCSNLVASHQLTPPLLPVGGERDAHTGAQRVNGPAATPAADERSP